ncbi:hypothetical protein GP486_007072, partial [Trichoglossum hirsutum]
MPTSSAESETAESRTKESTRKRRTKWERNSRERAKMFKFNPVFEWSDYAINCWKTSSPIWAFRSLLCHRVTLLSNINFPTLERLEKDLTFPNSKQDTAARFLEELRKENKYDILLQLNSELPSFPENNVILLPDEGSLKNALSRPFRTPLLRLAKKDHLRPMYCIKDFMDHLSVNETATLSVYNYTTEGLDKRTRQTTVPELLSHFRSKERGTALNFLDIENCTKIQFCPPSITLRDISNRIDAERQLDISKTGSEWQTEVRKEFFILSSKNAISTIHVDIVDKDGVETWVSILEGRKIWYFPRHVTAQTVRCLSRAGSQTPENYKDGWVKIELKPGDLL